MDDLKEIYDRITFLRKKGVKMKVMAEASGLTPSVLSAIYSTVLPAYMKNMEKGMARDEAIDKALVWVNNVSKKKLLGSLQEIKASLQAVSVETKPMEKEGNPFLDLLGANMESCVERITNYSGIYQSYSVSSAVQALKIEPYLIAPAVNGHYVQVGHNNAYGSTHWGAAMMNGSQHLYLSFNEQPSELALFHIVLKIPMFENPPFLRGLYTCFDYNFNPIARRILFVKQSDSVARDEFMKMRGTLKTLEQLTDQEKLYYNYTCMPEDSIRICTVPAPSMREEDLIAEKKLIRGDK